MGRIRTIKPELFKHEELFDLELTTGLPVRVAFMGLFTCCDREGRFKWRPRTIKLDVLPHDEVDFSRVLDALATRGFIRKYACDGKEYGMIPTWHLHQVINNRESESDIPEPTESSFISMSSTRDPRVGDALTTPLKHAQGEGKGKEGKGREEEGERKGRETLVEHSPDRAGKGEVVAEIFAYWQRVMGSPGSKLDDKRRKLIEGALKNYQPREICLAILGCSRTPHNMGENDRNTKYNGLNVILRDADQIDRFIGAASRAPTAPKGQLSIEEQNKRSIAEFLGAGSDGDDLNVIDMETSDESE